MGPLVLLVRPVHEFLVVFPALNRRHVSPRPTVRVFWIAVGIAGEDLSSASEEKLSKAFPCQPVRFHVALKNLAAIWPKALEGSAPSEHGFPRPETAIHDRGVRCARVVRAQHESLGKLVCPRQYVDDGSAPQPSLRPQLPNLITGAFERRERPTGRTRLSIAARPFIVALRRHVEHSGPLAADGVRTTGECGQQQTHCHQAATRSK